jgi:HEAT repeat protein
VRSYSGDALAGESLKAAGSNAVPFLIELTQYRVPGWRKRLPDRVPKLPFTLRQKFVRWLTPPDAVTLRQAAIRALGIIGQDAQGAMPVLIRALADKEGEVGREAARSLAIMGQTSLPALITVLQDETNSARGMAIYSLGLIGSEAHPAIPALLPGLTNDSEQLHSSTAYALTKLGPEAVLALIDLTAHGNPAARAAAANVLLQLVSSPESPIVTLRIMATDGNPTNRNRAMQALGDLRPASSLAVKILIAALHDPVLDVRLAAIRALGNIGDKATIALSELNQQAREKEDPLNVEAKLAIEKIKAAAEAKGRPLY